MLPADFRVAFPAFANTTRYPDPFVQFWLDRAAGFIDPGRWGVQADLGQMLWAAHYLVLGARDATVAAGGGIGGIMSGVLQSKSVDKASASYDTKLATEEDAGLWALTTYGLQYLRLARQMGAGPIQVDAILTGGAQWPFGSAAAWPGPFPYGGL